MKKKSLIFVSVLIIVFFAVIFESCEKEADMVEKSPVVSNTKDYKLPVNLKIDLKKENNLVIFKNQDQFEKITKLLMEETNKYIKTYFVKFDEDATVAEVNNQIDIDKFNPNLVYETFESYHSISSLRSELYDLEEKWLDNEELEGDDPSEYPLSERCLPFANSDGEYQIGSNIYRVEKSGVVFEIKNNDYDALQNIRSNPDLSLNSKNPNVTVHRADAAMNLKKTDCLAYVRRVRWKESGNHKMKMIIDLDWDGYGSAAKAKTKAYRWKRKLFGGSRWKREWNSMSAQVSIQDFDYDCNSQKRYLSGIKSRGWAYYVSQHVYAGGKIIRTQKGGYFWGRLSNGSVGTYYLSW